MNTTVAHGLPVLQHVAAQCRNLSVFCNFRNQKTLKNVY